MSVTLFEHVVRTLYSTLAVASVVCIILDVNFSQVYKVFKAVYEHRLSGINLSRLVSPQFTEEARVVVKTLESMRLFDVARTLSAVCDLDMGLVSIHEVCM